MENYYFSCDWSELKFMSICMENYYFSCDTEEG